jgi:hypothetical protein
MGLVAENTGFKKFLAVKTTNDKWLFDTTPMLQWFEHQCPEPSISPDDPALRFISLLFDEWLWRPSM